MDTFSQNCMIYVCGLAGKLYTPLAKAVVTVTGTGGRGGGGNVYMTPSCSERCTKLHSLLPTEIYRKA